MTQISFFTISESDLARLMQWGCLLMSERNQEALDSLREEGVKIEAMYLFRHERTHYALGYMHGVDIKKSNQRWQINKDHAEIKKLLKRSDHIRGDYIATVYFLSLSQ